MPALVLSPCRDLNVLARPREVTALVMYAFSRTDWFKRQRLLRRTSSSQRDV